MHPPSHEKHMHRCLELAALGAGRVAPNPMVGAVLVHENRIIGEGYHQSYGGPHAEVNCIESVAEADRELIASSTLYVSLEPCAHHGKTPPCADLIIRHKIPKVFVGCRDPFPEVDGKGIDKLLMAGVEVRQGILEEDCRRLNKRFFTFHTLHRPYIILKWAQTGDGRIGIHGDQRIQISGSETNRLVHRWRSEEASILVGTNTAQTDNPRLNNRLWSGTSPVRLVVDMELRLSGELHIFDRQTRTIIFNTLKHEDDGQLFFYQVDRETNLSHQIMQALEQLRLLSVIVEGGAQLLQSFIDDGNWDEARLITNAAQLLPDGVPAPLLQDAELEYEQMVGDDQLRIFVRH